MRGETTLDWFGQDFVLLRAPGADDAGTLTDAFAARGMVLATRDLATPALAALAERRLVLVRPDGHVCWRGDELPADPGGLVDVVRGA
jgi:hypothetical protein